MRIIAGKAGRTAIKVPSAVARPTTDFIRQAIFSILGEAVEGARVLDLFAGSGAIGLEALSRGAGSCVFVESHRQACSIISANLAATKLTGGSLVKSEVSAYLKRDTATYDLVFADPPYWKHLGDEDHLGAMLEAGLIAPRLVPGGWFLAEASVHFPAPAAEGLEFAGRRAYGSSAVFFFRKPDV